MPSKLPLVLAGPILRRIQSGRICLWLATSRQVEAKLQLSWDDGSTLELEINKETDNCRTIVAADHLYYQLIDIKLEEPLPTEQFIDYDLLLSPHGEDGWFSINDWAPGITYPGRQKPCFMVPDKVNALLHGSCRKPHHTEGDGLGQADRLLSECLEPTGKCEPSEWPAFLVMSGDQIYADDVAGPMLHAIHQLVHRLGLKCECLPNSMVKVTTDHELYEHPDSFYGRQNLLPKHSQKRGVLDILFGGVRKPIFTTANARNHLISIGEVLAMYLLCWSPACWEGIDLEPPSQLDPKRLEVYKLEQKCISQFSSNLDAARRVFAHLPVAMIFDDHDITDDWNLSREWEQIAYKDKFSRRVIGNALIGYLLNQGWGNNPDAFDEKLLRLVERSLKKPGTKVHDYCVYKLLKFEGWSYKWTTSPPLVVLDTRTQRWRSEISACQPSGLLDWEGLTDLQQTLRGLDSVLLVSPAPIFGVKLIETIQHIFTWFGKPLMVDAENWMAHPGAAQVILNVFRHRRTPSHFVILSGDVHYSFVYDVKLRHRRDSPQIWQICSSGIRNEFPPKLLGVLDHGNRWLYSPRSPLNWLTRRRRMRVAPRKPEGTPQGRRLLNGSGIGLVELDERGVPWRIRNLMATGDWVEFTRRDNEARED